MRSVFYDDISLSDNELTSLKEIVKESYAAPRIFRSIDGLHESKSAKLCGIYENNSLASFAWHMPRTWIIDGISFVGLSIGVLTTAPSYRNKGYATKLILAIEEIAHQRNMDFLYLAGIPRFYGKQGFKGFASKSKLVFNKTDLPKSEGTIESLTLEYLDVITKMHSDYSTAISSFSCRRLHEWEDLLGPLSSTFLFNDPKVVLNKNRHPIAYFCSTPGNSFTIREFVPHLDSASVITALSSIAHSFEYGASDVVEIFSPASGPVWEVAKNRIGADYMCFLRPNSSNMIKWISKAKSFNDYRCEFILQGDIL
jgi:GNAT superfamily N-acetyltransferase